LEEKPGRTSRRTVACCGVPLKKQTEEKNKKNYRQLLDLSARSRMRLTNDSRAMPAY